MKKLYILLAICLPFLFTSCSKDNNHFAGTWKTVQRYPVVYNTNGDIAHMEIEMTFYDCLLNETGSATLTEYIKEPVSTNISVAGYYYNDGTQRTTFKFSLQGVHYEMPCIIDGRYMTVYDEGATYKFKRK